jgi:ferric-dicitrate binding protein FerR (iron transport regulator)
MLTSLEQLLTDDSFRRFVLNPNQAEDNPWESWINQNAENQILFQEAKEIIRDFYQPLSSEEFQFEAIRFKRSIEITHADKNDIISLYENRHQSTHFGWYKYAAVFAIIISTLFVFSWLYFSGSSDVGTLSNNSDGLITRSVERGAKRSITFHDGTKVKLNSESYITFPEKFNSNTREVTLVGEAFFEVTQNKDWPFIVNTKNARIQVFGTSFNVNSFDLNSVSVALVEGSVRITSDLNSSIYLEPLEMAIIDPERHISVQKFDLEKITSWKDNKIVFKKASFDEIEATLERWFNVEFIYSQKPEFVGGYTATIEDENLDNIMKGMSADKFEYELKDGKVFINQIKKP